MRVRSWALLVGIGLGSQAAVAQPVVPSDSAAVDGEVAYKEGRRLYDLQEWDRAIVMFKKAYELRSDAASLFNIAQSYRLKGDCVTALGFYKTYRRNFPNEKNIDRIDAFIIELEPCAKQGPKVTPAPTEPPPNAGQPPLPPPGTPAPSVTAPPNVEVDPDPGSSKRMIGIGIASVGVAALATGVVFGLQARSKSADVSSGGDPENPIEWNQGVEDSAQRADLLAKILVPAGTAAIIGGVVLYVMGRPAESTYVSATPTAGGATLVWRTAF